jgi:glutamate-1-semialdehyde 2,1-aminomutase
MGSTRLPGKVMQILRGKPCIYWVTTAAQWAYGVDSVWLATTTNPADDVLAGWAHGIRWLACFRGAEEDVLGRCYQCATLAKADIIIRLTGDCPLLDSRVIAETLALLKHTGVMYASNVDPATWPDGLDVECFTMKALRAAWQEAVRPSDHDTVTQYIARNKDKFPSANLTCPIPGLASERWVLDSPDDLEFMQRITQEVGPGTGYLQVLDTLRLYPDIRDLNKKWTRNERFFSDIGGEIP